MGCGCNRPMCSNLPCKVNGFMRAFSRGARWAKAEIAELEKRQLTARDVLTLRFLRNEEGFPAKSIARLYQLNPVLVELIALRELYGRVFEPGVLDLVEYRRRKTG